MSFNYWNDEYRKGYRDGYSDGFKDGQIKKKYPKPDVWKPMPVPVKPWPIDVWKHRCSVCGLDLGNNMGYCCGRSDCPSKVVW